MKKLISVFILFFTLNNFYFSLSFSQEESSTFNSLKQIFTPYVNIVDEYTDSNIFFKDWNNLEYLRFIDKLTYIYTVAQDIPEAEEDLYSFNEYQRNKLKKDISSILIEIFGSILLQKEISNENLIFIPEHQLDSTAFIDITISENKHDGVLVKIEGDKLIIYNVLEAKLIEDNYNISQTEGVFKRWKKSGIYILKKHFESKNIIINTSKGRIPIEKCSFGDFKFNIVLHSMSSVEERIGVGSKILKELSKGVFNSFYLDDTYNQLEKININFIDRVLFLLKNYIQIYHEIPSLSGNIPMQLTDAPIKPENFSYYSSYFSNENNRKDLILTLYTIYKHDFLYPIFEERFSKFFNSNDMRFFYSLVHKNERFGSLPYLMPRNHTETLIDTLVSLLGDEYKEAIEDCVNKNRMLFFIGKIKNYNEILVDKFNELKKYFGFEKAKAIVLTNLKHFVIIRTNFVINSLEKLEIFFKNNGSKELFYLFVARNFYKILTTQPGILFKNIDIISDLFFKKVNNSQLRALDFILKNHLELMTQEIRLNIRAVYDLLQRYKGMLFYQTLSEDDLNTLCLNNINTLVYLNVSTFMNLYNTLRNGLKFTGYDVKEIILHNFRYLHMINTDNLYNKLILIIQYLKTNYYSKKDIHSLLQTKLYNLSYLSIENTKDILEYLTKFLGKQYKINIYNWLKDVNENFKDIDSEFVKQSVEFLLQRLKDIDLVKYIIANVDNFKYLDLKYLRPAINRIFTKISSMNSPRPSIQILLAKNILNLNDILGILYDKKDTYFLTKKERWIYQRTKIDQLIETATTTYNTMKSTTDCSDLFTK